ncbi:DUF6783 domain-containing protein [uncultured Robinsoniella sp.]|uniref:DUF6783 domain-containing protein n=1 Tax=uncultured Robinsoniella sp. TaxID=904190 RepID=UPI00374EB871
MRDKGIHQIQFAPNSGFVARYAPFIRDKSTTNCDAHLSEINFQTRSRLHFLTAKILYKYSTYL